MANKFVTFLQAIGRDFEKFVQPAVMIALPVVTVFDPPVGTVIGLLMGVVVLVEQKFAAKGQQSGTGAQKAAEVIATVGPAVTAILEADGIAVDSALIAKMVDSAVAILNTLPAPTKA